MTSGQIIDVLISIAIGGYCILTGMGIVRVSKNPERQEEWTEKYGTLMTVLGVVIVILRIFLVMTSGRR
jgi:hypothetical protein